MAKLKDSLLHWKKKLERTTDEDVISDVIRKLQRIPMTIELLQETGIGKVIRTLRKNEGKVGEKASTLLKTWRDVVSSTKTSEKAKKDISSSSQEKYKDCSLDTAGISDFGCKQNYEEKVQNEISENYTKKIDKEKNSKHLSADGSNNIYKNGSDHRDKKSLNSSYSSYTPYDLNSDINEGYCPDHPALYPTRNIQSNRSNSEKQKNATDSIDMMAGMFRVKKVKSENPDSFMSEVFNDGEEDNKQTAQKKVLKVEPNNAKRESPKLKPQSEVVHSRSIKKDKKQVPDSIDAHNTQKSRNQQSTYKLMSKCDEKLEKFHSKTSVDKLVSQSVRKDDLKVFRKIPHPTSAERSSSKSNPKVTTTAKEFTTSEVSFDDDLKVYRKFPHPTSAERSSGKSKPKVTTTAEEFTSSEVSFEDCLGFNDIVKTKKKKVAKVSPMPMPKKSKSRSKSPVKDSQKAKQRSDVKPHKSKKSQKFLFPDSAEFKLDDVDIISTLPEIQPNYRPLPQRDTDGFGSKKKTLSNEEAILFTSSKKEKTAVYSGRKNCFLTEVPTLYESCVRVLIENIDYITYIGAVPYFLLKPVLERCTALQLYNVEYFNAYLLEDTNELWEKHCKREFRSKIPEENETWREMYCRVIEEQKMKLKSITANISASMTKSNPARKVKLTYIDSVAKPPRDVARKQAKHGTGLPTNFPMKAEVPSKAPPRPTAPAINIAALDVSSPAPYVIKKPKVAPLMAKTLKSMKQCYRRK